MRQTENKDTLELENWFLANLELPDVDFGQFEDALLELRDAGAADRAEACAELLMESLSERRAYDSALALLRLLSEWHSEDASFAPACEAALRSLFRSSARDEQLIPHLGFDRGEAAGECLRRLALLRGLVPGALCYAKTWRFGIVSEIDWHSSQLIIDFNTKKQHRMSFSYAAENLQLLDETHILARRHSDPAAFAKLGLENPGELVKLIIRDFGPMNAAILQELIATDAPEIGDWKSFWDKARKQLKSDPLVLIPQKRSEPIMLLEGNDSIEQHWAGLLEKEKRAEQIVAIVEGLQSGLNGQTLSEKTRELVAGRLYSVLASPIAEEFLARALLSLDELGMMVDASLVEALLDRLLLPSVLAAVIQKLPARAASRLVRLLALYRPGIAEERAIDALAALPLPALNLTIEALLALNRQTELAEKLRELAMAGKVRMDIVSWLCSNIEFTLARKVCTPYELFSMSISTMEAGRMAGADLRARNRTRELFKNKEWLKQAADQMDDAQRRDITLRVKISKAWPEHERNLLLAHLTDLHPELRDVAYDSAQPMTYRRVTSHRSYAERQALLRKLVEEDIPKNIEDIAVARGFGDLSENYEYQAAKETQGMLMERRKELEIMLAQVSVTSFENASCEKVGVGTTVSLRRDNGELTRYVILGEWDHDQELGIISCASPMAQALLGHKPGDEVVLPGEPTAERCAVQEVAPLTEEIKNWISPAD